MNLLLQPQSLLRYSARLFAGLVIFATSLGLVLNTNSIPVEAQATSGTLTECNFRAADGKVRSDVDTAFEDCLGQVFQFIVVVAIMLILFRIALSALKAYNPLGGGDNNVVTIVADIVLGLLFIGGPYLILTTLNPALTNFDITDLGAIFDNIETGQNQNGGRGDEGNGGSTTGGEDSSTTPTPGGSNVREVDEAVEILNGSGFTPDGEPVTETNLQAAVESLERETRIYEKCHWFLLDAAAAASPECLTWRNTPDSVKASAYNARLALKNSDSAYKDRFNPSVGGPERVLTEDFWAQAPVRVEEDNNLLPKRLLPTGCYYRYLKLLPVEPSTPPRLDGATTPSGAANLDGIQYTTFHTFTCPNETNPFFAQTPGTTDWQFQPQKTVYQANDPLLEVHRTQN